MMHWQKKITRMTTSISSEAFWKYKKIMKVKKKEIDKKKIMNPRSTKNMKPVTTSL